ncbi:UDP-3-O-acyl-N-acetylglucosamine deacetylase [bacterium]|nr:UDP-3-O-acyl-N-acetylglucosamine deacetylase [bacterium]
MIWQQTIKTSIGCSGIGLHSGKKVRMTLRPAPPDTGIVFKRVDIDEKCLIEARFENLINVNYATTLRKNGYKVQTVEHILAALMGLGIDNLIVEIDSTEIPIMDGSAVPFIFLIHEAGIIIQDCPRKYLKIKRTIHVGDKDKFVRVLPDDQFRISYSISFNHPVIGSQSASYVCTGENFIKKISRARTFGFLSEIKTLRKNGLAKGGSLDNAVVIDDYRILNGKLRYRDEFVCHKIIDAMGDIYLLGYPIVGHLVAYRAGHSLHAMLVDKILKSENQWEYVTYHEAERELTVNSKKSLSLPQNVLNPLILSNPL